MKAEPGAVRPGEHSPSWWDAWLARRGAACYIAAHWPWPGRKPWQQRRVTFLPPGEGIGDELMCTPLFAEINRRNPECEISFVTRYPDLFRGHPLIDHLLEATTPPPPGVRLSYRHALPPPRPLIELVGESAGLRGVRGEIVAPPIEARAHLAHELAGLPRHRIAVQPLAGGATGNKNWPRDHWQRAVNELLEHASVYEVGTKAIIEPLALRGHFISFAGRTSVAELAWLISQADLFIGPPSSGMHLASAYGIPSLVIFGGYEAPSGYAYSNLVPLYNPVTCAPCWRRDCSIEHRCLRGIDPETVIHSAIEILARQPALPAAK